MSKLTSEEVAHVAKLSSLTLTKGEIEKFQNQLSRVLSYFEELSEVHTETTETTSQTTELVNKTREDAINSERILSQDEALSGSDKTHNGYFVVPALLNKDND